LNFFNTSLHCDRSSCDRSLASFPASLSSLFLAGPFAGLHPVFVLDLHDRAGSDQLFQQRRNLLAEFGAAFGEIRDEQVGQGIGIGANPGVKWFVVVRELADQKNQRADLVAEFAVVFLLLLRYGFGDFL
jgi:hypothetical protein